MKRRGVTLVEVLVASGLFAMILTAILSFYIEAAAVSAKRDEQSQRLRRFHLGLDKMEQVIRRGRVISLGTRLMTLMKLSEIPEKDGFPNYEPDHVQFISTREGVLMLQGEEKRTILPLDPDEQVIFGWVQYNPPLPPAKDLMRISLYRVATSEHSELLFTRTIPLINY